MSTVTVNLAAGGTVNIDVNLIARLDPGSWVTGQPLPLSHVTMIDGTHHVCDTFAHGLIIAAMRSAGIIA
jgi:hypothetical protein